MLVGPTREGDAELLADDRVRAVAAGEKGGAAGRSAQAADDAVARFLEVEELGPALDPYPEVPEPLDEEALVLVLRIDESVGIRAERGAERAELDMPRSPSTRPEIRGGKLETRLDHLVGESELAIELQGPHLDGESPGGRAWLLRLVDDADANAKSREPDREHEPGRSGSDDEDLGVHTRLLLVHFALQVATSAHGATTRRWPASPHDPEAQVGRVPALLAQDEPAYGQAAQSGHLQDARRGEAARAGRAVLQAALRQPWRRSARRGAHRSARLAVPGPSGWWRRATRSICGRASSN